MDALLGGRSFEIILSLIHKLRQRLLATSLTSEYLGAPKGTSDGLTNIQYYV